MKQKVQALIIFSCFFFATFLGCLWINSMTPALLNYDSLPIDFNNKLYSAKNVESTDDGYSFTFENSNLNEITLILDRTAPFELRMNNEFVMSYFSTDTFNRTVLLTLDITNKKDVNLEFIDLQRRQSSNEFDRLGRYRPVILLGDEQTANNAITLSFGINMLYCGILLFICFNSFFLYHHKKSEVYLLLLSALCLVEFIKTFLSANFQVVPLTDQFVNFLLPTVYQGSSILILIIGYYLCGSYVSDKIKQFLPLKTLLITTIVVALVQNFIPYSIISFLLFITLYFCIISIFHLSINKKRCAIYFNWICILIRYINIQ